MLHLDFEKVLFIKIFYGELPLMNSKLLLCVCAVIALQSSLINTMQTFQKEAVNIASALNISKTLFTLTRERIIHLSPLGMKGADLIQIKTTLQNNITKSTVEEHANFAESVRADGKVEVSFITSGSGSDCKSSEERQELINLLVSIIATRFEGIATDKDLKLTEPLVFGFDNSDLSDLIVVYKPKVSRPEVPLVNSDSWCAIQ